MISADIVSPCSRVSVGLPRFSITEETLKLVSTYKGSLALEIVEKPPLFTGGGGKLKMASAYRGRG